MSQFLMPSLGADMEVGTIIEWRVHPGDQVHRGDIVAVVDTEKADIEVEVFDEGVIGEVLVEVGRQVPVGTPLATIVSLASEERSVAPSIEPLVAPTAQAQAPAPAQAAELPPRPSAVQSPPAVLHGDRVRASPWAKRVAAGRNIALRDVVGSGPGGAIRAADVARTADASTVSTALAADRVPHVRTPSDRHQAMRDATAELMARSKREIPHYYLADTVDVGAAIEWIATQNRSLPVTERLLPAALLLKAVALAAREVPTMNGFWSGSFRPSESVHLGVAVSLRGGGLVAPAIHDADALTVHELMAALRDLVARARSGHLRASEMSDPTLTVTNLGEQGAERVFGVIYPPQVALVGIGRIVDRPVAHCDSVVVHPTVTLTLSADHRASDGHEGSRFVAAVARRLLSPEEL